MEVLENPSLDYVRVLRRSWFSERSYIHLVTAAMFVGMLMLPIGLLIVGWTVEAHTPWIAPDIVSAYSPQISHSTQILGKMKIGLRARRCRYHS